MSTLNVVKKLAIDSQIYVAIMATSLAVFFMLEQNAFRFSTTCFLFITYLNGYLYTKYQNRKIFSKILVYNFITTIIAIAVIIYHHDYKTFLKWLIVIALGLLYNSQFLTHYVRKIPLLKIFYVGMIWGLINGWVIFNEFQWTPFLITFLYISALVLPFDIRDLKSDTIVTFPRKIGVKKTKILGLVLIIFAALVAHLHIDNSYSLAFSISSIIAIILLLLSNPKKSDLYYSFLVESCCGLCLFVLFILEMVQ